MAAAVPNAWRRLSPSRMVKLSRSGYAFSGMQPKKAIPEIAIRPSTKFGVKVLKCSIWSGVRLFGNLS